MSIKLFSYWEHCGGSGSLAISTSETNGFNEEDYTVNFAKLHRQKTIDQLCYRIFKPQSNNESYHIETSYFVGLDWIEANKSAIYVAPKNNTLDQETDFVKMLFEVLKHPQLGDKLENLLKVKWEEKSIAIDKSKDLLTPFLAVQFLHVLKVIVKKGLKKSYYREEKNLKSRVKGKVLVSKTIKRNVLLNKRLNTYCSIDEFGVNNKENIFLKKTLSFVQRYLNTYSEIKTEKHLKELYNYILPAFREVSNDINVSEIKSFKSNNFYKEYKEALHLAELILKRFGFNISSVSSKKIETPPFWIDMSKLFELYTLGLLKDQYHSAIDFQKVIGRGNELDFLLNSDQFKLVIDAKYKYKWAASDNHDDVRQLAGYSRLKEVYSTLGKHNSEVVDGLIIYPTKSSSTNQLESLNLSSMVELKEYSRIYKLSVVIPCIRGK